MPLPKPPLIPEFALKHLSKIKKIPLLSKLSSSSVHNPTPEELQGHKKAQGLAYQCAIEIAKDLTECISFLFDHEVEKFLRWKMNITDCNAPFEVETSDDRKLSVKTSGGTWRVWSEIGDGDLIVFLENPVGVECHEKFYVIHNRMHSRDGKIPQRACLEKIEKMIH